MNAQIDLIEGTTRDLSKSQYFTTPDLAQRVVEWAWSRAQAGVDMRRPMRVLEPSAGNGALVRPLVAAGASVYAFELDERYRVELMSSGVRLYDIRDFLTFNHDRANRPLYGYPGDGFDLCVMNPPYENGLDVAFILHALKFAPRVVGIFTDRILFGVERKEGLWSKVRPTRIAFQSRRPFKGAQTDYVVLELVMRSKPDVAPIAAQGASIEWW